VALGLASKRIFIEFFSGRLAMEADAMTRLAMEADAMTELLQGAALADGQKRHDLAAHLSKIAAKAEGEQAVPSPMRLVCWSQGGWRDALSPQPHTMPAEDRTRPVPLGLPGHRGNGRAEPTNPTHCPADPILLILGTAAASFVEWLETPEPLVKAYAACILANVAFLREGQDRVREAGGIGPLLALLREKHESKVTLHAAAAVQNLTFKSEACCRVVLQLKGDKLLKKLYNHASSDVQQFSAGALANLQLYRSGGEAEATPSPLLPTPGKKGRKKKGRGGAGGAAGAEEVRAAVAIQAVCRGRAGRQRHADIKRRQDKKKPRYETFSVHAVRSEFESGQGAGRAVRGTFPLAPMGGPPIGGRMPMPLPAPSGLAPRGAPAGKLAPIGTLPPIGGGGSNSGPPLPPLAPGRMAPSSLSPVLGVRSALTPVR